MRFSNDYLVPERLWLENSRNEIISSPIPWAPEDFATLFFEFNLLRKDPNLTIGFSLFDGNGIHLLRSLHTDLDPQSNSKLKVGRNILSCRVPLNLLNEGQYRLVLDGGLYQKSWDFNPFVADQVSITLEIEGGFTHSPFWRNKRHGILAPGFQWEVNN
jgi:hypothetical protein